MSAILLSNVSKSFVRKSETRLFGHEVSHRKVLENVNLEVAAGERVCVLGKNGSGKTTLAKILSTLIAPSQGEVKILGYDTLKQGQKVREHIGVVLNAGDSGFQPRLSSSSNLEYFGALYGISLRETRRRIPRLMAELGIEDRNLDQIQSYSTGMRRRLALARALLPDPSVLILDEPTLGIDPWSMKQIHSQLVERSNRGTTILCMTNNMAEAQNLAQRTLSLDQGRLVPFEETEPLVC